MKSGTITMAVTLLVGIAFLLVIAIINLIQTGANTA